MAQLVYVLFSVWHFGLWLQTCVHGQLTCLLLDPRYATVYTMFPVFSLVLDQDVKPEMAMLYPELYKDLTKVRHLSLPVSQLPQAPSWAFPGRVPGGGRFPCRC